MSVEVNNIAAPDEAVLEALLEKGVILPADYHRQIQVVEQRRVPGS